MVNETIINNIGRAGDGGPIYTETNFSRFIVEPFNALSAFLFIALAVYWFIKLRGQYAKHKFLTYLICLLMIGGIGGTIYHAFRYHQAFLMMDWIPIAIIIFSLGFYFFHKAYRKWWLGLILIVLVFVLNILNFRFLGISHSINISYVMMALTALIPIVIMLYKTNFYQGKYVLYAVIVMLLAVLSRTFDSYLVSLFPMGTHFLWHVFGLLGTQFILMYVYEIGPYRPKLK